MLILVLFLGRNGKTLQCSSGKIITLLKAHLLLFIDAAGKHIE